jgi:glycosyltransferase involved in cell wall biosynthesis
LQLQDVITCAGWVPLESLSDKFVQADLYLSASDSETFGLTYLSALATRTPCVVYDYPVSREVIPHPTSVFLKTFDPTIWADAVKQLQEHPDGYQQLQKGIRDTYDTITQYREDQSTKELMSLYRQILKSQRK